AFDLKDCVTSLSDGCDGALDVDQYADIQYITSDEPDGCTGGGPDKCGDVVITGNATAKLRAERCTGNGSRLYTVHFTVTDFDGNTTPSECLVEVPARQGAAPPPGGGCALCAGSNCPTGCPGPDAHCSNPP